MGYSYMEGSVFVEKNTDTDRDSRSKMRDGTRNTRRKGIIERNTLTRVRIKTVLRAQASTKDSMRSNQPRDHFDQLRCILH